VRESRYMCAKLSSSDLTRVRWRVAHPFVDNSAPQQSLEKENPGVPRPSPFRGGCAARLGAVTDSEQNPPHGTAADSSRTVGSRRLRHGVFTSPAISTSSPAPGFAGGPFKLLLLEWVQGNYPTLSAEAALRMGHPPTRPTSANIRQIWGTRHTTSPKHRHAGRSPV
jgi:hypothetical protein